MHIKIYPNCYIIICYFHIIRRLVIHLPQIRSKNKESKELAKNLLADMKILLFLPQRDIYQFFDLIKNRYYEIFPKFIKYFYKNFFMEFPLNRLYWNYYYTNLSYDDNGHYFLLIMLLNHLIEHLIVFLLDLLKMFQFLKIC